MALLGHPTHEDGDAMWGLQGTGTQPFTVAARYNTSWDSPWHRSEPPFCCPFEPVGAPGMQESHTASLF